MTTDTKTMTLTDDDSRPAGSALSAGLGPDAQTVARWYCVSRDGLATLCKDADDAHETAGQCDKSWPIGGPHRAVILVDAAQATKLRAALTKLRDRITGHPAYADLTEEEEEEMGGDTAELSYLARVADAALGV